MSTSIQPTLDVFPREFAEGNTATLTGIITNSNPDSTALLTNEDRFTIVFQLPWGESIKPGSTAIVNSPSGTLKPTDFRIGLGRNRNEVTISMQGPAKPLLPGEGFGFILIFKAPQGVSFGVVTVLNIPKVGRIDATSPRFVTLGFIKSPTTIVGPEGGTITVHGTNIIVGSGKTTVNGGTTSVTGGNTTIINGSTSITGGKASIDGGNTTITGGTTTVAGGTVTTGSGTTVTIGPGTIINIEPGAPKALPTRSNFLQIAVLKWYDAAQVQRTDLPGRVGALTYDGTHVWAALDGYQKLVRIDTASGTTAETPLTGRPALPLGISAMVYDGEKFWISGAGNGVVVRPDGVVLPNGVPLVQRGTMLFDGLGVWGANGSQLVRIDASTFEMRYLSLPVNAASIQTSIFDGANIWFALGTFPSPSLLLRLNVAELLTGTPASQISIDLDFPVTGMTFDGHHVWTSDSTRNAICRWEYDAVTSSIKSAGTFTVGEKPGSLLFDGTHIWVLGLTSNIIVKVRAADGVRLGQFSLSQQPTAIAFDGINIWVGCSDHTSNSPSVLHRL